MSESLIFLSESLIHSFFGKKQAIRSENQWANSQPWIPLMKKTRWNVLLKQTSTPLLLLQFLHTTPNHGISTHKSQHFYSQNGYSQNLLNRISTHNTHVITECLLTTLLLTERLLAISTQQNFCSSVLSVHNTSILPHFYSQNFFS